MLKEKLATIKEIIYNKKTIRKVSFCTFLKLYAHMKCKTQQFKISV